MKLKTVWAASTAVFLVMSTGAMAGWTSGGGNLRSTEQNPWFVQNTKTVSYCIDMDEANFGQTIEVAREKISNALNYWKGEFSASVPWETGGVTPILGTQRFIESECSPQTDITFKLGTLTTEQEQFLKDPASIVGITVRTDYDNEQLRGKGFVYVSPERGRLALRGNNISTDRWTLNGGKLLELLLIHELGHLFGMPHEGNSSAIMGESFPDELVQRGSALIYADTRGVPSFLKGSDDKGVDYCQSFGVGVHVESVFGIPKAWACLKIVSNRDGFKVYAAESAGQTYQLIGTATNNESGRGGHSVSHIILPDTQRVFVTVPIGMKALYLYPRIDSKTAATFVNDSTQIKSQIVVTQTPELFSIDGSANGNAILLDVVAESTWQFSYDQRTRLTTKKIGKLNH
jgi:hypothetical protein